MAGMLALSVGCTRPAGSAAAAELVMVMYPASVPRFGSTKLPVYVAPAVSTITSPESRPLEGQEGGTREAGARRRALSRRRWACACAGVGYHGTGKSPSIRVVFVCADAQAAGNVPARAEKLCGDAESGIATLLSYDAVIR